MSRFEKMLTPKIIVPIFVVGEVITFTITYSLSWRELDSCVDSFNIFIDSSIAKPPASMIGAFGMSLYSIAVFIVLLLRWAYVSSVVPPAW